MPQHEEHCQHSFKRYGVRGDDIHTWIDEPSLVAGGEHRRFRHDLNSLQTAIQLFGSKYGEEMVENIFLDHLKADAEEERNHRTEQSREVHNEPYLDPTLGKPMIKVFQYKRKRRLTKISFKGVRKGQKLRITLKVSGGNNDVIVDGERIRVERNYELEAPIPPLKISNTFSIFTNKTVEIICWIVSGMAYGEKQTQIVTI